MSSFKDIIAKGNVLVDFHATWCGPCKVLGPVLQDLAKEWGDQVKIIKVDVDRNPELSQKLAVQGVPTMIFYVDGQPKWRKSGALPKHVIKQELEAFM